MHMNKHKLNLMQRAVRAYMEPESKKNQRDTADLQWIVHHSSWHHTLVELKSGKILFDTGNREKIVEYLNAHPELKCDKPAA